LITDQYFYRYVPQLKQVDQSQFSTQSNVRDLNYLILGFGAHINDILRVYAVKWLTKGIAPGYDAIQLSPLDKSGAKFQYITIMVTNDGQLMPAQFSMMGLDGVRTTVNLNLQTLGMGATIRPDMFTPNFPVPKPWNEM